MIKIFFPQNAELPCLQFPVWWTYGESDPNLIHAMEM